MKTTKRILVLLLVVCVLAGTVSGTTFATSGEDYIETGQAESETASEEAATEPEPDSAEPEDFAEEPDSENAEPEAEEAPTVESTEAEDEKRSHDEAAAPPTPLPDPEDDEPVEENEVTAKRYVNYYLMAGDTPVVELDESVPYLYTEADADNYEQIVFSAMDWHNLSEEGQSAVNALLAEATGDDSFGYLTLLQDAVYYALDNNGGYVGQAAYTVSVDEDGSEENEGIETGFSVASLIEQAGLSDEIVTARRSMLLKAASYSGNFDTDKAVKYSYSWRDGAYIYKGTTTGYLGPFWISSPYGDVAATYVAGPLHTGYLYSYYMDGYYDCYCMSARSVWPTDKWVGSSGSGKWNDFSANQREGLVKAMMYGTYYYQQSGNAGAFSGVQCIVWSIIHGQMDKFGQGTGNIYDAMDLYDSYYTACWRTFAQVRDCMWIHGEKPTFTYSTSAEGNAHPVTLTYDAATGLYTAKLKDTGWCSYTTWRSSSLTYLEEYFTFTAVDDKGNAISGIKFSADDDTLTITATPEALAGSDVITVRVKTPTRGGSSVISVYDSIRYLGSGWQPIITNWEITGTPLYVYMSIQGDPKDPKIDTNAYDNETKTRTSLADKSVTVVDSVIYEDLNAGQTYTATATLMDKSTGKALTVNGKTVTASSTFMAYDSSGVVNVPLTFDATGQYDKDFVVFEEVTLDGKTVCEHKDLTSAAQTIHTSSAGTITVMKQNADGTAGVPGVTYSITDKNGKAVKDSKGKTLSNITTDKSGCAAWANVPYGDYLITEVKTVDGYSLLADSIPVTMPLAVESEIKPKDGTRSLYEMGNNTTYLFDLTCTVRDGAVFEMPMTGDKGFVLIPLAMTLACMGTIIILTIKRKK